jgi:hypothetical protein
MRAAINIIIAVWAIAVVLIIGAVVVPLLD